MSALSEGGGITRPFRSAVPPGLAAFRSAAVGVPSVARRHAPVGAARRIAAGRGTGHGRRGRPMQRWMP